MTIGDFHNLFIGRMGPNGNEYDVRHVINRMAEILHKRYPGTIQPPSVYLTYSNKEKLKAVPQDSTVGISADAVRFVGTTVLEPEVQLLFDSLKMNTTTLPYIQLSEFRSRITYLAFPNEKETPEAASEYVAKIVNVHSHASILAANQVVYILPSKALNPDSALFKYSRKTTHNEFLVLTIKELRALLLSTQETDAHFDYVVQIKELAKAQWPVLFS